MKRILTFFSLLILTSLAVLVAPAEDAREEAVFDVEGMTCGSCADSITAALSQLEGVGDASTDFKGSLTRVSYDPAHMSPEKLAAAVSELGHPLEHTFHQPPAQIGFVL